MFNINKKKEYYFIAYEWWNLTTDEKRVCNVIIDIHPLKWLILARDPNNLRYNNASYQLLFYKVISKKLYLKFEDIIEY